MASPPAMASFDFDDTLQFNIYRVPEDWANYEVTGHRMSPIIKDIITRLSAAGTTLYMVTSRKDSPENRVEVIEFLQANGML